MPETFFQKLKNKIPTVWLYCFCSALVVGFIAHFYKLTNWMPNWDSLVFRHSSQNMLEIGRWFLPVVCSFSSFYDLPFINGLLSVIFHGLGAVCICKIFGVERKLTAILIGGIIVSYPTVVSIMMYGYVADGYGIGFFIACLGAVYFTKSKPNYIAGIVLLAFAVGVYQAYVTVTAMLVLMYLTDLLVFKGEEVGVLYKKSALIFVSGFLGMALYYIILTLVLKLTGTTLTDYQGISSSASFAVLDIPASLYIIKNAFMETFFDFSQGMNVFNILNIIVMASGMVFAFASIVKTKMYSSVWKIVLLLVYVVLMPIGSAVLAFINVYIDYHNLMKMGYCLFYILFVVLYERVCFTSVKLKNTKTWIVLLLSLVVISNQIIIANVSYHVGQMAYEKSYGTLIRIADRIEQTEGTQYCNEILVVGALEDSTAYGTKFPPDITGVTQGYILRADDESVKQSVLCSALNDYCGKEYKFLAGDKKQSFLKKAEVSSMKCWPEKGCVSVIDGVIVIKMGTESVK